MSGLYLHIPFCRKKCPYCDFFSVALPDSPILSEYVDLLVRHLELVARTGCRQAPWETVFFGGGTPSLLPPEAIDRILAVLEKRFGLAADAEISLEANPGTVSREGLIAYRAAGINRLSLGIQSLDGARLEFLGRPYSGAEARQALAWAQKARFAALSADLMFGLPGAEQEIEIDTLLDYGVTHLALYGLTVEEETPFYHRHRRGELTLPDDETCRRVFLERHARLEARGLRHYEISNYARPGRECRHNLRYWRRRSYLGVGCGAHTFVDRGWGERRAVPPDLERYAGKLRTGRDPARRVESFDRGGAMAETLYLGLRTAEGVDDAAFRRRFGAGVAEHFPEAVKRCAPYLRQRDNRWAMTVEGWLLYDHLIAFFL